MFPPLCLSFLCFFSQSFVHVLFLQLSSFPFKRIQQYLHISARNKALHSLLRMCCFIRHRVRSQSLVLCVWERKRWRCVVINAGASFCVHLKPYFLFTRSSSHSSVVSCTEECTWASICAQAVMLLDCSPVSLAVLVLSFNRAALHMITVLTGSV